MRFHASGELSIQNKPISVWSGVRALGVVMSSPPSALISLKSAAYAVLVTGSGGPGRNCEPLVSTNGVTAPHVAPNASGWSGVKRHSPG